MKMSMPNEFLSGRDDQVGPDEADHMNKYAFFN
jgi:hypothetical protein